MFDITTKAVAPTADCELLDNQRKPLKDAEGNRCSITVCGPASVEYAEMRAGQQARSMARVSGEEERPSAEQQAKEKAEDLAAITKSFNNFVYPGKYSSNEEMFKAAYTDKSIGFIADQVNLFAVDWGNFSAVSNES